MIRMTAMTTRVSLLCLVTPRSDLFYKSGQYRPKCEVALIPNLHRYVIARM